MKYDAQGREVVGFPTEEDVTVTGDWTFSGTPVLTGVDANGYALRLTGVAPFIQLVETDAAADEGMWDIGAATSGGAGQLRFRVNSDAGVDTNWMLVERTGTTVDSVTLTATQVLLPDGAATTPGIAFSGDPDTGFWRTGSGDVRFQANGTSRVQFTDVGSPISVASVDTTGDCWMGFYESTDFATRKGYIGYGNAGSDEFYINQEENHDIILRTGGTSGDIFLQPNAATMLQVNSTGVAFHGATPAARPDYTVTNPSTDRALNVTGDTTAQVAAVLGTLIADLIAIGLLQ